MSGPLIQDDDDEFSAVGEQGEGDVSRRRGLTPTRGLVRQKSSTRSFRQRVIYCVEDLVSREPAVRTPSRRQWSLRNSVRNPLSSSRENGYHHRQRCDEHEDKAQAARNRDSPSQTLDRTQKRNGTLLCGPPSHKTIHTGSFKVSSSPNQTVSVDWDGHASDADKPLPLGKATQNSIVQKGSPLHHDDTSTTYPATEGDTTLSSSVDPLVPVSLFQSTPNRQSLQDSWRDPLGSGVSIRSAVCSDEPAASVSFGSVSIHSHQVILGDNPSVSGGPPLTLDWKAFESTTVDLEAYESYFDEDDGNKRRRRTYAELRIPQGRREKIIRESEGYRKANVRQVLREIDFIRRNSSASEIDSMGESTGSGSTRTAPYNAPFFVRALRNLMEERSARNKRTRNSVEEEGLVPSFVSCQIDC
jgi:hypothetical protein